MSKNDVALDKIHADNKLMRLDILVEIEGKELVNIEEINKIVDIVMTDDDVWDALNTKILQKNLEQLKQAKAFKDGEESRKRDRKRDWRKRK